MPITWPSVSATSRWCCSTCERTTGPARSGPMACTASAMTTVRSARCGGRMTIGSIGSGSDLLVELLELVDREVLGPAALDDLALVGVHPGDALGNLGGDLRWNADHAVVIAVDQVARLQPQAADLDGQAEVHHVDPGVGDGDVGRRELEAQGPDLVEVPHGAVGHDAHAPERPVDVGLNFRPLRALATGIVQ